MFKKIIKGIALFCGVLFILIVGIAIFSDSDSGSDTKKEVVETIVEKEPEAVVEKELETIVEKEPELTIGQKNCLTKAKSYLELIGFSKEGLRDQLQFDGFEDEDIDFVLSQLDVDYKEQAFKKAESYLDMDGFSRDGLYEQLDFEKFTDEEIEYALEKVGY